MPYVTPIETVPNIKIRPAPILPNEFPSIVREQRIVLEASDTEWDGPIQMVTKCNTNEIEVCHASYAWLRAMRDPKVSHRGVPITGMLGVCGIINNSKGEYLFAKRADNGWWAYSYSGNIVPGVSALITGYIEAAEELGLSPEDLHRIRPFVVARPRPGDLARAGMRVDIVFRAELDSDGANSITPNPKDVADYCWSKTCPDDRGTVDPWMPKLIDLCNREIISF